MKDTKFIGARGNGKTVWTGEVLSTLLEAKALLKEYMTLYDELEAENDQLKRENEKYQQALQEIKEIVEPIYCDCHGECEEYIEEGLKQILEKCEDVLND